MLMFLKWKHYRGKLGILGNLMGLLGSIGGDCGACWGWIRGGVRIVRRGVKIVTGMGKVGVVG